MKIPYVSSLLATVLAAASLVHAQYPAPGGCTGDCWGHDPGFQVRRSDGRYFRFSTGGGIRIHSAPSLTGPWQAVGDALPNGSIVNHPGNNNLWAPDVHYDSGRNRYYMYYSVSTLGSRDSVIGIASSPNLTPGSWTDHGGLFRSVANGPFNAIDANFATIGGESIITFGSYWNGIHQVPLDGPLALTANAAARQVAYNSTGHHSIEAGFVISRDSWYYLFFSSGRAGGYADGLPAQGEEYRIVVCRSRTGRGGFVDRDGRSCLTNNGGTTVLASHGNVYGPGGQGLFEDSERGWVLYYHYANPTIGLETSQYQFGWNALKWSDGWPSI
ncbi:Arabinan endo-1,5-alpha-L-arabinosidase C [Aspergillus granulosus]|uniref:Arabinan endo-1,5-alpha-L-arabinosidase n=1 Tax=Aspergillus granulosus TaxID=176169 RepID=A0ABR4H828_9EURO